MRSKKFVVMMVLVALFTFAGSAFAQTPSVRSCPQGYTQFSLAPNLATYLGLTKLQIDTLSRELLWLNYDWSQSACTISSLQSEITVAENDSTQSPVAIGLTVGRLTEQKVVASRAAIALVKTYNASLLKILTQTQLAKLAAIQNALEAAWSVVSAYDQAFGANLFIPQYLLGPNTPPMPPTVKGLTNTDAAFGGLLTDAANRITADRVATKRPQ